MKKGSIWLIIAALLVLGGGILFCVLMTSLGWDFTRLSTVEYESNTYEISEGFSGISVNTDTADIVLALSDDGTCRVECREETNAKHSVSVKDGVLTVELINERSVYDFIGLRLGSPSITVYLPEAEYESLFIRESTGSIEIPAELAFGSADISASTGGVYFGASARDSVKIKTSTGYIGVENISAGALDLEVHTGKVTVSGVTCSGDVTVGVSTGKAYLTDIVCRSLISKGDTGDISLNNVIAAEKISIERSTGDVKFIRCDAAEIYVETDTGDVSGSLLSDKIFVTDVGTGSLDVPESIIGGKCVLITDMGDIKITIQRLTLQGVYKKASAVLYAFLAQKYQLKNFGRELVFSVGLCYNRVGVKAHSRREL
jgi:DUF4097 and DUF4098 domain-containing protein YvlB